MSQRKYREVTEDDIGKMIEVTDERPAVEGVVWRYRKLLGIDTDSCFPFLSFPESRWKYARIEVADDPA